MADAPKRFKKRAQHQRELTIALKRARQMALIGYAPQHLR